MLRFFAAVSALVLLGACADIDDLSKKPQPIGDFALGHNIIVAPNMVMGPASREASKEDWIAAMTKAVDARFDRFDGEKLYHFGISLEGYVLAQPGLPVVLSPKSVLIMKITVWDDSTGTKLNEEPEQITVLEKLDGDTIVGSGLTKTAEEQMATLSENAAKQIQLWMTRQSFQKGWFKSNSTKKAVVETEKTTEAKAATPVDDKEAAKAEAAAKELADKAAEKAKKAAAAAAEKAVDDTADAAVAIVAN